MEIRPATLDQVMRSKEGRMVAIDNDVQNVANDLAEIDPHFRLRYSEAGEYFVVYWQEGEEEGDGYLVTTAQEIDQRIVQRVREIYHRTLNEPGYSYANEIEKQEAKAKKDADDTWREEIAPVAEQLAYAMRKDLGLYKDRTFFQKGLPS